MRDNKLKLNEGKTQMLLLIRRRRAQDKVEVRIGDERVSRCKTVRCLGVWIDDGLTWRQQIEIVRKKCFMGLAKLKRLRNILPTSTKKKPHLDYCSVLWQECSKVLQKKLDRIQSYGMRLILSQPPRTPSAGLRIGCPLEIGGNYLGWGWYTGV